MPAYLSLLLPRSFAPSKEDTSQLAQRGPTNTCTHNFHTVITTTKEFSHTYSNQTGNYTAQSRRGNNNIFIIYSYDFNTILSVSIKNLQALSIKDAWDHGYTQLQDNSYAPTLHIIDNKSLNRQQVYNSHHNYFTHLEEPSTRSPQSCLHKPHFQYPPSKNWKPPHPYDCRGRQNLLPRRHQLTHVLIFDAKIQINSTIYATQKGACYLRLNFKNSTLERQWHTTSRYASITISSLMMSSTNKTHTLNPTAMYTLKYDMECMASKRPTSFP